MGIVLQAMRDYVFAHRDDIDSGINDFADLRPVLMWFQQNHP